MFAAFVFTRPRHLITLKREINPNYYLDKLLIDRQLALNRINDNFQTPVSTFYSVVRFAYVTGQGEPTALILFGLLRFELDVITYLLSSDIFTYLIPFFRHLYLLTYFLSSDIFTYLLTFFLQTSLLTYFPSSDIFT